MIIDQWLVQRIRHQMRSLPGYEEKRMFGGVGFIVNGNTACGIIGTDLIMKVGPDIYEEALNEPHARPFDMTKKPMKG